MHVPTCSASHTLGTCRPGHCTVVRIVAPRDRPPFGESLQRVLCSFGIHNTIRQTWCERVEILRVLSEGHDCKLCGCSCQPPWVILGLTQRDRHVCVQGASGTALAAPANNTGVRTWKADEAPMLVIDMSLMGPESKRGRHKGTR